MTFCSTLFATCKPLSSRTPTTTPPSRLSFSNGKYSILNVNFARCPLISRRRFSFSSFTNRRLIFCNFLRAQHPATLFHSLKSSFSQSAKFTLTASIASHTRPIVGWWLLGTSSLVFGIVLVGGLTRLTESGLSMVKWSLFGSRPPSSLQDWQVLFNDYKDFPEYKMYVLSLSPPPHWFIPLQLSPSNWIQKQQRDDVGRVQTHLLVWVYPSHDGSCYWRLLHSSWNLLCYTRLCDGNHSKSPPPHWNFNWRTRSTWLVHGPKWIGWRDCDETTSASCESISTGFTFWLGHFNLLCVFPHSFGHFAVQEAAKCECCSQGRFNSLSLIASCSTLAIVKRSPQFASIHYSGLYFYCFGVCHCDIRFIHSTLLNVGRCGDDCEYFMVTMQVLLLPDLMLAWFTIHFRKWPIAGSLQTCLPSSLCGKIFLKIPPPCNLIIACWFHHSGRIFTFRQWQPTPLLLACGSGRVVSSCHDMSVLLRIRF